MRPLTDKARWTAFAVVSTCLLYALFLAPDMVMIGHLEQLTRSDCLLHRPWLVLTYALADGVTWLAYWSMPVTFLRLAYAKKHQWEVKYNITRWVFSWLAAFIFLCGLNHLFDLLVLRYSLYEQFAHVKVALALCSAYTALWVVRQIQTVYMIPRDLLQQKVEELRELVRRPATDLHEYRAILEQGMKILDSVADGGHDK